MFKPIQIIWYCSECQHTMIQVLPNDPPKYCYRCKYPGFSEYPVLNPDEEEVNYEWTTGT